MADWLTVQWPARRDRWGESPADFEDEPHGVWVEREHEEVAKRLRVGDRVFVYETRTGPSLRQDGRVYSCVRGRQGIVAVGRIRRLEPSNSDVQHYASGRRRTRRWAFGGSFGRSVDRKGFVPRGEVNRILGYARRYVFLGFGTDRSGTGPLTLDEATRLQASFDSHEARALGI